MSLLSPTEQTKWQTLITAKAIAAGKSFNKDATTFLFHILNDQKKYGEMISQISDTTPYSVILKYCENMLAADKARFLNKMAHKYEKRIWNIPPQEDNTHIFPELTSLFRNHYSTKTLSEILEKTARQLANHHINPFMKYLQNHL
jgi:Mg/Co/Ni transporter MgtE